MPSKGLNLTFYYSFLTIDCFQQVSDVDYFGAIMWKIGCLKPVLILLYHLDFHRSCALQLQFSYSAKMLDVYRNSFRFFAPKLSKFVSKELHNSNYFESTASVFRCSNFDH